VATATAEKLHEATDVGSPTIEATEPHILKSVRVLSKESRNRRTYPAAVLEKAIPLFEGCLVNVDHDFSGKNRSYEDNIGVLKNVRLDEKGLYGDLFLKPTHRLFESILFDFQHATKKIGLSFYGDGPVVNGSVTEIEAVKEVDLVLNPATTRSLRESEMPAIDGPMGYTVQEHDMLMDHHKRLAECEGRLAECEKSLKESETARAGLLAEVEQLKKPKPAASPHIHPDLTQPAPDLTKFAASIRRQR
jgi:hypothetical protein